MRYLEESVVKGKIKSILLFLIGLGVLAYVIWRLNIDVSVVYLIAYPRYVLVAALLILSMPMLLGLRMNYLLLSINDIRPPLKELCIIEYINKFLLYIAPFKLHLPAKAVLLKKMCKVKASDSVSVITLEYALDSSITIFVGIVGALVLFKNLPYISLIEIRNLLLIIILCIIAFFCLPSSAFESLLRKSERITINVIKKPVSFALQTIKAIRETWRSLLFNRRMYYILPITALFWGITVLATESLFLSTGHYVPLHWILVVMTCGIVVGGVTTIPGGLGVREATMVLLYSVLGVPGEISVVVVLVSRLLAVIPICVGYVLSLHMGLDYLKMKNIRG